MEHLGAIGGADASAVDGELVARVQQAIAGTALASRAAEIDAARELPADVIAALVDAGVFKLLVPRDCGGAEATLATSLTIFEDLAYADGAVGWCAMIGATTGLVAGFLAPPAAAEAFGPKDAIACGAFATIGRATPVDGGYRVSGRWRLVSGCRHAGWFMGGTIVDGIDGGGGVLHVLIPVAEIRIADTWDTSGLRGTGSHDVEIADAFVPVARCFAVAGQAHRTPRYHRVFFGACAAGIAAVSLGIARRATDAFVAGLAVPRAGLGASYGAHVEGSGPTAGPLLEHDHPAPQRRRPAGSSAPGELVAITLARAEARVSAARAFLFSSVAAAAADTAAAGSASLRPRAQLRLSACHAAAESAAAVDLLHAAAGASAIYRSSALERCFRDIHVASQHAMVGPATTALIGRILCGADVDASNL